MVEFVLMRCMDIDVIVELVIVEWIVNVRIYVLFVILIYVMGSVVLYV